MWIANAARSREIDRQAQEEFGISSSVLMERAGIAVFAAVQELLPEGGRLAILCGKGNNGGDGFVVARVAAERGFHVECLVAATEAELGAGAAHQRAVATAQGVQVIFSDDARWPKRLQALGHSDLIIDGLLGTGAKGAVQGTLLDAIRAVNRSGVPVVSIDLPSGVDCDTGEELGESIWALRTVSFGLPKPCFFQGIGLEHAGYWTIADIGFPAALTHDPTDARLLDSEWVGTLLPERLRASHKGDNGAILIVAGSNRMRGAAVLAARAALRSGAGLVTVAAVESVCAAVAAQVPEATLLPLVEHDGIVHPSAADTILSHRSRFDSGLFGPGLSVEPAVAEFLDRVWRQWDRPACIDADALTCVSQGVALPAGECVLTPHPGEMSRLLHSSVAEIQADRFQSLLAAMSNLKRTVILKGPYSIAGESYQPMLVNCTGNSGMASAGMGDVLSGVVATLLAQDLPAYHAAGCAMYWHGLAGDLCAQEIAPVGYTAMDVAEALPRARAKITLSCDGCSS